MLIIFVSSFQVLAEVKCPSLMFKNDKAKISLIDGIVHYSTARLLYQNQGACVGTSETYIVLHSEYGQPRIAGLVEGHNLKIDSYREKLGALFVMSYKAGASQTVIEFSQFNSLNGTFDSFKKFSSNLGYAIFENGIVSIKNQTNDNGDRAVLLQKYKLSMESLTFKPIE